MKPRNPNEYMRNMALATVAGQSGCMTAMLVVGALLLGLWLDSVFDSRPVFTLGLVISSVPISLILMVYVTLGATRRMTPPKVRKQDRSRDEQ